VTAGIGSNGARGSVTFTDAVWGGFTANVIAAKLNPDKSFTFTAQLTSSTYRWANMGDTYTWTVYDNGNGLSGTPDSFTYDHAVIGGVDDYGTGATQYPATAGNISVFSS
jgi:hypothetical protein